MLRRAAKRANANDSRSARSPRKKGKSSETEVIPLGQRKRDEAVKVLEKLVLGDGGDLVDHLVSGPNKKTKKTRPEDEKPKPVWEDDEDNEREVIVEGKKGKKVSAKRYTQLLKSKFEDVSGTPSWAKLKWEKSESEDSEGDDKEGEELLQGTGSYLGTSEWLPKGLIQMKKCADANQKAPSKGRLKATEFHPSAQVMLAAGTDHTLRLFQVDGKTNPLIQSIFLEDFPMVGARFNCEGTEVILSSHRDYFYYYDMIAGKVVNIPKIRGLEESQLKQFVMSPDGRFITFLGRQGRIHLLSTKSKEWITTLKMNGEVQAASYTPDCSKMLSYGGDGEVYVWDMQTRDCVHRFYDDGAIHGTALAISRNSQFIATGSNSGVVNIYDQSCMTKSSPKPLKSLLNLTTSCTSLTFNSTGEILAMAADESKALKLVHFPSMTVFSNYPNATDRIGIPLSMDFSLNSGYFTVGNQRGKALLYRLNHYSNY